ncbi:hypothetical protein ABB37_05767 [Leptomonas pyrrhocoris]|uniref:Uncharacterized protein n=1 Tax=Leptomonas pyrrhocoris TaxID=157538 RepID=A0A0N0DUZ4_LEPPY|nr:hypothetical protein ABB37_05767 [Leptomonas pyrrhocoris]KPA79304.1 hypothetical protein ABB37_05767 [Leptomonas pyrrhocoris]|eukprot:XP_015657743.1 hypothetical protein ABB37_05767 [Leptomonas pyrrhocoris]
MGYGGPRVAFYTANEYANYASAVDREDAARVRSIAHRRDSVPESELLRQREETFRAYEAGQAAEAARLRAEEEAALEERKRRDERHQRRLATRGRRRSLSAAESATLRARQAHLNQLAQPRRYAEPAYGSTTYGLVMHQRGCKVEFPVGRNNAVYMPGVDRDRIVPSRPVLDASDLPPWIGSYSSHHGPRERERAAAEEEAAYYCGRLAAPRSAVAEARKQATLRDMAAEHAAAAQRQQWRAASAGEHNEVVAAADSLRASAASYTEEGSDAESVFSHGSSNGPIRATGNMHICTASTKESVQLHLSRYGGAMTAPRLKRDVALSSTMNRTLPELSYRLVKMQAPYSQRR